MTSFNHHTRIGRGTSNTKAVAQRRAVMRGVKSHQWQQRHTCAGRQA